MLHGASQAIRRLHESQGPAGRRLDPGQHEQYPRLPFVGAGDGIEKAVVLVLVAHDVTRQIQDREFEQTGFDQGEQVQDATGASVAVEKWVDGLELIMGQRHDHERVHAVVAVQELLPRAQVIQNDLAPLGRRVDPFPVRGGSDVGARGVPDDGRPPQEAGTDVDCCLLGQGARGQGLHSGSERFTTAERLLHLWGRLGQRPVRRLEQLVVGGDDVLDLVRCLRLHQGDEVDQHGGVGQPLAGPVEPGQCPARRNRRLQDHRRLHILRRWERG